MALAGLVAFTACQDDRDSNPVFNNAGDVAIVLNAPEFANVDVALGATDSVMLTWSQPQLTNNNAPLGAAGIYGLRYIVQASKDGNFTKTFADALKEVTNEDGTYNGTPTGYDYTSLTTEYSGCIANLKPAEINQALNELNVWASPDVMALSKVFFRVLAVVKQGDGSDKTVATSNVQEMKFIPSQWIDVMAEPVKEFYYWVPGNGNGWNHGVCPILRSEDGEIYTGYAYMDGEFKFTPAADWKAELNNGSFDSASDNIDLGDKGGGNIIYTGEASMCWITLNLTEKSLTVEPCKWGLVGSFGWEDDIFMTYNTTDHCLEAAVNFDEATEWKYRRDAAWTVNLGGSLDNLEANGANITGKAGTKVKLFLERPSDNGGAYTGSIE